MDDHAFYLANELIDELTKQVEQDNFILVDYVTNMINNLRKCNYPSYRHYVCTHDKFDNHIPRID